MKISNITVIALVGVFLSACSAEPENKESTTATGVIPAQQLKALEKAKGVEQQLLDAQSERLKAVN